MREFAQKQPPAHQTARTENSILHANRRIGNLAAHPPSAADTWDSEKGSITAGASRLGHDFGLISVRDPRLQAHGSPCGKQVEGGEESPVDEGAPAKKDGAGVKPTPPAPAAPAVAKTAGVDSFQVKWSKPSGAGAANAKLRLDFTAKFKKDSTHDPALAEFRQSAGDKWDITAGPNKGRKGSTPMEDDHYSRADDLSGHAITDVDFYSNDNPGYADLDKDDVLDYTFTAEQTIIDTSQANKVIATRGPHTGTVKGKHPRTYTGVPANLS